MRTAVSLLAPRLPDGTLTNSGKLTKDRSLLVVFKLGVRAQHGAKVVVVNRFLVLLHPVAPLLLARLALHFLLVEGRGGVEVGKFFLEAVEDFVIHLCQPKLRAWDLLENRPIGHQMFDGCGT